MCLFSNVNCKTVVIPIDFYVVITTTILHLEGQILHSTNTQCFCDQKCVAYNMLISTQQNKFAWNCKHTHNYHALGTTCTTSEQFWISRSYIMLDIWHFYYTFNLSFDNLHQSADTLFDIFDYNSNMNQTSEIIVDKWDLKYILYITVYGLLMSCQSMILDFLHIRWETEIFWEKSSLLKTVN